MNNHWKLKILTKIVWCTKCDLSRGFSQHGLFISQKHTSVATLIKYKEIHSVQNKSRIGAAYNKNVLLRIYELVPLTNKQPIHFPRYSE